MTEEKKESKEQNNMIAILSYIGILFVIPLLVEKDNDFVQYHAKQGMTLFIAEIVTMFIAWIPILGWLVGFLAWILWFILAIVGIVNVVNGKKKPLPIIGGLASKLFKS